MNRAPLFARAAHLIRLLDEGRRLPTAELRAVLAEMASFPIVRTETVREERAS